MKKSLLVVLAGCFLMAGNAMAFETIDPVDAAAWASEDARTPNLSASAGGLAAVTEGAALADGEVRNADVNRARA